MGNLIRDLVFGKPRSKIVLGKKTTCVVDYRGAFLLTPSTIVLKRPRAICKIESKPTFCFKQSSLREGIFCVDGYSMDDAIHNHVDEQKGEKYGKSKV